MKHLFLVVALLQFHPAMQANVRLPKFFSDNMVLQRDRITPVWYQGEFNAGRAYQYRTAFPLMINDWCKRWQQGDFPFYFVQLSSFQHKNGNSEKGSEWAERREAQALALALPNTGMAVTTDIGDALDIHPKNKQEVGKRLAAIALHKTYSKNREYGDRNTSPP